MAKRFRLFGEEEDSINLAKVLMLLSKGQNSATATAVATAEEKVFECKTCSRQFPSFQALGGHRASHKKPRLGGAAAAASDLPEKPRVHGCSVCGLEFSIGQALGGHMRRHRSTAEGNWSGHAGEPAPEKNRAQLDLNLPPLEQAEEEVRQLPKLLGFTLTPAMIDCFQ